MAEIFINSSIAQLAESLCLYQEARTSGWSFDFVQEIGKIDPKAVEVGCMWPAQVPSLD